MRNSESIDDFDLVVRNEHRPDGVRIRISGRPLLDQTGTISGGVIIFRDVTRQVRTEEALLQAFSEGRLEVLETILHNIGNAINSVAIGTGTIREELLDNLPLRRLHALAEAVEAHRDDWISYLQRDPQGQRVLPFIIALARQFSTQTERLQRAVTRVTDRVTHIVDIIRTQRALGGTAPVYKDVELRQTIMEAVKVLQESLTKRAIELQVECAAAEIRIQESRFHQMIINLIKNAMEAIEGGGVTQPQIRIRARVEGDLLLLDVIDNGIGLEPKSLPWIFSPGYTTKTERQRAGAALRSQLRDQDRRQHPPVQRRHRPRHHHPGPLAARRAPAPGGRARMIGNTRVLIVDDQQEIHDDFREILLSPHPDPEQDELSSTFLQEDDHSFLPAFELLHASNGEDACARIAASNERSCPIAVAFIDIRMPPGIDGVETVRRIREIDRHVEIVIMTAYAEQPLSEIVKDMELLDKLLYIRKPFAREEIQQIALSLVTKWNGERELARQRQELGVSHQPAGGGTERDRGRHRHVRLRRPPGVRQSLVPGVGRAHPGGSQAHVAGRGHGPLPRAVPQATAVGGVGKALGGRAATPWLKPVADAAQTKLFVRTERPVRDPRGTVIGDLMVYRDVSSEIEIEQMRQEVQRLQAELEQTYSFAGIVGASAAMRQVYALIRQAAAGDIAILIRGESGTGKELVAKALHFNGRRKTGPFLAVNCAAVPETPRRKRAVRP